MHRKQLIKIIQSLYPITYKEKGDPIGWQKLKGAQKIKKILVCLDVTQAVANKAVQDDIDLIIHHHPFLYNGIKKTLNINWKRKVYNQLLKNNIGLYAMHTNCDFNPKGMNYHILKELKAKNITIFNPYNLLLKGSLPDDTTESLVKKIKALFGVNHLHYANNIDINPLQIVVVAGSGGSFLRHMHDKKYLYITGDLKWNEWMMVQQEKIPIITVGHYMENVFIDLVHKQLTTQLPNIKIIKYSIENPIKDI